MKRGEVRWVNFEPSIGGEIRKRRPAIILRESKSDFLPKSNL
jgi:mRNA interferase MazF